LNERLRAPALFVAIFAAALAVTVLVVGSRSTELVLEVTKYPNAITPNGDRCHDKAEISFFVRESDPAAQVSMVGKNLKPIRTLAVAVPLEENEPVTYFWDAKTDDREQAPVGRYRLRVVLPSQDRDMVWPRRIDLRHAPPIEGPCT
jgi:hypothetical protein